MKLSEKQRMILMLAVIVGIFALCGISMVNGEMSLTQAIAISASALTSVGVLGSKPKEDEGK